jgi:hypothetical protein
MMKTKTFENISIISIEENINRWMDKNPCIDCKRKQWACLCSQKVKWDNRNTPFPENGIRYYC